MNTNNMRAVEKFPVIDFTKCSRCNKCVKACPTKAIIESPNNCCAKCIKYCMTMDVPCSPEIIIFNYELCDSCGKCVSVCPDGAVYWFIPNIISSKQH